MKRIRAVGEELLNKLKSKTILIRKPRLKICSNHKKTVIGGGRVWSPFTDGQAFSDNQGWYTSSQYTEKPAQQAVKKRKEQMKIKSGMTIEALKKKLNQLKRRNPKSPKIKYIKFHLRRLKRSGKRLKAA